MTSEEGQVTGEESTKAEGSQTDKTPTSDPPNFWRQVPFLVLIFVVMYMLLFRGPKKKQQKHKQMVQELKKNDRIRTIGGILGTVIDVKDDEITIKIDEANNTKIKIIPGAIGTVLSDEVK